MHACVSVCMFVCLFFDMLLLQYLCVCVCVCVLYNGVLQYECVLHCVCIYMYVCVSVGTCPRSMEVDAPTSGYQVEDVEADAHCVRLLRNSIVGSHQQKVARQHTIPT